MTAAISIVFLICSAAWVANDARRRDWSATRYRSWTPRYWSVMTLLLWIIVFPLYLGARRRAPLVRDDATETSELLRVAGATTKRCPKCAEDVLTDAQICRYCNHEFVRQHHWYDGWKWAAAALGVIVAVAYFTGGLDTSLSGLGLNTRACAENLFGKKMCGDELVQFCQDNYAPTNRATCDGVLDDEGIDPEQVAAARRSDERRYERCVQDASSVGAIDDCGAP